MGLFADEFTWEYDYSTTCSCIFLKPGLALIGLHLAEEVQRLRHSPRVAQRKAIGITSSWWRFNPWRSLWRGLCSRHPWPSCRSGERLLIPGAFRFTAVSREVWAFCKRNNSLLNLLPWQLTDCSQDFNVLPGTAPGPKGVFHAVILFLNSGRVGIRTPFRFMNLGAQDWNSKVMTPMVFHWLVRIIEF